MILPTHEDIGTFHVRTVRGAKSGVVMAAMGQLVAVLFVGSVINAQGASNKLSVGYLTISSAFGVLWVTREAGIFEKNGLDVQTVYMPPTILIQSMLAKEIAIGFSGGSSMIDANLRGADFVLLGSLEKSPSLNYLVTRPEITQVHELKGKKLGISRLVPRPTGSLN